MIQYFAAQGKLSDEDYFYFETENGGDANQASFLRVCDEGGCHGGDEVSEEF